jgi:hypothetical protein
MLSCACTVSQHRDVCVFPVTMIRRQMGNGRIAPRILNLCTTRNWSASSLRYTLDKAISTFKCRSLLGYVSVLLNYLNPLEMCFNIASFEASTVVMFQVEIFWFVTLCSDVVGYQRFGSPSIFTSPSRWRQHGPPKRSFPTTALHGVTS